MDEIVVQAARAIASWPRLQILTRLAAHGEMVPTKLTSELRISLSLLSVHLTKLSSAGLVRRRRSGKWIYCVPGSRYPTRTFSGQLASWLSSLLRDEKSSVARARRSPVARALCPDDVPEVHRVIFDAATAFTHPRRIQILRQLERVKAAGVERLAAELRLSPSALSRHGEKLIRRGY